MQLITQALGTGTQTEFPFEFPFLKVHDIKVSVGLVPEGNWSLNADGDAIVFLRPPVLGALVEIERHTTDTRVVGFTGGAILLTSDLDKSLTQTLHIAEEAKAYLDGAIIFSPILQAYNAKRQRISNVGIAIDNNDAVTLNYIRARLGALTWVHPSQAEIDAAVAAINILIVTMTADRNAVLAHLPTIEANILSFAALLAAIQLSADTLPPVGADLISRIDTELGQTYWRDLGSEPTSVTDFTADGSWTPPDPTKFTYVQVECVGAGAAGASFDKQNNVVQTGYGAAPSQPAGGGGGYTVKKFRLSDFPAGVPVPITVGDGGVPAAGYTGGRDGEATSFGSYLTAPGGKAPVSPLVGGDGGAPVPLKDLLGQVRGRGGIFEAYSKYEKASLVPTFGYWTGGGGGAGHDGANNADTAVYPGMSGSGSEHGAGGGGGGYAPRALQTNPPKYLYIHNSNRNYSTVDANGNVHVYVTNGLQTFNYYMSTPTRWKFISYLYAGGGAIAGYILQDLAATPAPTTAKYLLGAPGGLSQRWGAGGDGGGPGLVGRPGIVPGGGGGGAGAPTLWTTSTATILGGAGARGLVRLTFW